MRRLARRATSLVALATVLAGIPGLLVGLVGWPLPRRLPPFQEVTAALGDGWRPGERFVSCVLALVVWVVWARLVSHVVAEVRHQRRWRRAVPGTAVSGPRPAAHRGSRRLAGWLVGGIMVAGPLSTSASAVTTALPTVLSETVALDRAPLPGPPDAATALAAPAYVVRTWEEHRDCLWTIAERLLGDPLRWTELLELNAELVQPSGRRLGDDPRHWVYPGMALRLPTSEPPPPAGEEAAGEEAAGPGAPGAETAAGQVAPAPPSAPSAKHAAPSMPAPSGTTPPAGGTAERGAAEPSPRGGADRPADVVPLGRGAMRVAQALALGLPVFAAGGLVAHLTRRRRVQVARHRPGRDIVRPDPALEPLERRARVIASDEAAAWVDATVRVLASRLRCGVVAPPTITCVRAGQLGVEVLLAEPAGSAPPGFAVADDGHVWRLDAALELTDLQAEARDVPAPTPALVSIGASPEGPLLADLESFGVLSVEGSATPVGAFLSGIALELVSAPWAEGVDLRLVGPEPGLGGVDGVTVVDDLASLVPELAERARCTEKALGDSVSTMSARVRDAAEPWLPTVVVVRGQVPTAPLAGLMALARPCSGVVVVVEGPVEGARWRLAVVDDGCARLQPLGLDVRVAGVAPAVETDLGHLDDEAITAAAALVAAASHDEDVAPLVSITTELARARPPTPPAHEVWVAVLGPVEITGWASPAPRRRKLEELLSYIATHDEPVRTERLRTAIWPDVEMDAKSLHQAMSRLRRSLGPAHLPAAVDGCYRRAESVGCDWLYFQELAATASRSRPEVAMASWRAALELVRGEPFGGGLEEGRPYVWAVSELLIYDMQVAITKAADALAELALAAGDFDTALWASAQGHRAMPYQLSLFDWRMRVAGQRGDLDGLNHAYRARRQAEQTLDPTADLPPETVALYEQLRRRITSSSTATAGRS